jgi:GT2 family glycosyltransferase
MMLPRVLFTTSPVSSLYPTPLLPESSKQADVSFSCEGKTPSSSVPETSLPDWLARLQQGDTLAQLPEEGWLLLQASLGITCEAEALRQWQTFLEAPAQQAAVLSYANAWLDIPFQEATTTTRPRCLGLEWLLQQNYAGPLLAVRKQALKTISPESLRQESTLEGQWHALVLELLLSQANLGEKPEQKAVCFEPRVSRQPQALEQQFYFALPNLSNRLRCYAERWAKKPVRLTQPLITEALPQQAPAFSFEVTSDDSAPLVSILLPFRNRPELLTLCLNSVLAHAEHYPHFEVIGINNQSDCLETLALMQAFAQRDPRIRFIDYDKPFNYAALNNEAARQAKGDYLLLLNNDIELLSPDWLKTLLGWAQLPNIGAVGAKLYYPNNTVQHAGCTLGLYGTVGHSFKHLSRFDVDPWYWTRVVRNVSAVTGACILVNKQAYWEVGGLDEVGFVVAYNDIDFCLKLQQKGYRNLVVSHCQAYHHESVSRKSRFKEQEKKERALFRSRYATHLNEVDPYYSTFLNHLTEWTVPVFKPSLPVPRQYFFTKLPFGYQFRLFRQGRKWLSVFQTRQDGLFGLGSYFRR